MEFLGNEDKYAVQITITPTAVEPVVGSAFRGSQFMAPIGGGVEIEPELALEENNVKFEDKGQISNVRSGVKVNLQDGQWWWD